MLRLIQILALPALVVGCLSFFDLFILPAQTDSATITDKTASAGRGGGYRIYAKGRFDYGEGVPGFFYSACRVGDRIDLALTPVFKEWRHVSIIRDGDMVAESQGTDIAFLAMFCAAFFVPALSFIGGNRWTRSGAFLIFAVLIELIALCVLLKFLAVYLGHFQKI